MRIAHVLTYISADGAFGGPVAVLSEQTTELARRGHRVEVFAGWDGQVSLELPGVDVHLFETRQLLPMGFSGLVAPGLRRQLLRRRGDFDVVHVHLARDLITTPVAYALRGADKPLLFLQPHGMVKPDRRPQGRVSDLVVRPTLAAAAGTFSLTDVDRERLLAVEPRTRILDLPNGVSLPEVAPREDRARPEVLFLARLQPRKRVLLFAAAARRLLSEGVDADFVVVGPDEGDLPELTRLITAWGLGERVRYEGSVPPGTGRDRIARADLYVLPSLQEPFPMSVLESLSTGTPTVISATCHIADRLGDAVAAFPEAPGGDDGAALATTLGTLLADDEERRALGRRGRRAIESAFSVGHVGDLLEHYYSGRALGDRPGTESGGLAE
ncbi:glycosyltransferase [Pseudactinotalea suaedae]|uniref:glycosyltransferase n=1 Tax=Pseudactinotalea suaedae TaxID=1524924 RepID=UPI0012E26F85|nr:glycosyltransferase [Pseudactinotalea suaedae]